LSLFGEEHAFGPISLDSLHEIDLRVIQSGGVSIVPKKDEDGRAILHVDRGLVFVRLNGREAFVSCFVVHFDIYWHYC
jgi:hypothetical protein